MQNQPIVTPRMYLIYKWFQIFFQSMADMFQSCAEIGMAATLKAEYMQCAQEDLGLIAGSKQDPGGAED